MVRGLEMLEDLAQEGRSGEFKVGIESELESSIFARFVDLLLFDT